MNEISIHIKYYAFQDNFDLEDFQGINDFKNEVSKEYVSNIKGIPVGRGGGVYELIINTIINSTLQDFLNMLIGGVVYDTVKFGSKSLLLKPFFKAFEKLNSQNSNGIGIREFRLKFEETEIIIKSIDEIGIYQIVPKVFKKLITIYPNLKHTKSQHYPQQISIPVLFDKNINKSHHPKYREPLVEEEYLENLNKEQYFHFWGLNYEFTHEQLVFDLEKNSLTEYEYCDSNFFETFIRREIFEDSNDEE